MDGRTKKIAAILIVASIVLISALALLYYDRSEGAGPIRVDGNEALDQMADKEGWSGDGSEDDPYQIKDITMNVTGSAPCIQLSNTTRYVTIHGCDLAHRQDDQGSTVGIRLADLSNVIVLNTVVSSVDIGMQISSSSNVSLLTSSFDGAEKGIDVIDSDGLVIINSTFDSRGSNVIAFSQNSTLVENDFTTIEGTGLIMQNSSNNFIIGNLFKGTPLGAGGTRGMTGLVLSGCDNNTFFHSDMTGGGYLSMGMSVIDSDDNAFSNCQITGRTGIYMLRSNGNDFNDSDMRNTYTAAVDMVDCDRNLLFGNQMNGANIETAIRMLSCDGNAVVMNNITGRSIAYYLIHLNESSGNMIYNNTFRYQGSEVRTSCLAFDDTGLNSWNDTAFGNYWSDWTGPDADSNGIVDEPYVIDGAEGATDWYPLEEPLL